MARSAKAVSVRASSANTSASTETFDIDTSGREAIVVVVKSTAGSSYSMTPTLLGVDPVTGATYTLLAGAAITATGTAVLTVGRGLTAAANVTANGVLPRTVRVSVSHTDTTSVTYTISATIV